MMAADDHDDNKVCCRKSTTMFLLLCLCRGTIAEADRHLMQQQKFKSSEKMRDQVISRNVTLFF